MKRYGSVGSAATLLVALLSACGGDAPSLAKPRPPTAATASSPPPAPPASTTRGVPTDEDAAAPPVEIDAGPELPFTCTGKRGAKGDLTLSLTSGGQARTSLLHVPAGYDAGAGAMLVVNFHGFGSDAGQQVLLSNMNTASDKKGFVVAYPFGVGNGWNAGACCTELQSAKLDDVAFTKDLLRKIASDYCIDPKRIFATGMSNGGFFTHRLACEMADTFAAFAPVAGVLGIAPETCNPARAVPILHFHGTADALVPYDGGQTNLDPLTKSFLSVQETANVWRAKNGCLGGPETTFAHGDTSCTRWAGCSGKGEVNLCTIAGGGHTWPGGLPVPTLGKTSTDINATDAMIEFFAAHPLPSN